MSLNCESHPSYLACSIAQLSKLSQMMLSGAAFLFPTKTRINFQTRRSGDEMKMKNWKTYLSRMMMEHPIKIWPGAKYQVWYFRVLYKCQPSHDIHSIPAYPAVTKSQFKGATRSVISHIKAIWFFRVAVYNLRQIMWEIICSRCIFHKAYCFQVKSSRFCQNIR